MRDGGSSCFTLLSSPSLSNLPLSLSLSPSLSLFLYSTRLSLSLAVLLLHYITLF